MQEQQGLQRYQEHHEEDDNMTTPLASERDVHSAPAVPQHTGSAPRGIDLAGGDQRRLWIEQDPARTPTSSTHPPAHAESYPKSPRSPVFQDEGPDNYFAMKPDTQQRSYSPRLTNISHLIPSHKSVNSSSASLHSSVASDTSVNVTGEFSGSTFGDGSSTAKQTALGKLIHAEKASSTSPTSGQSHVPSRSRQEGPHYPNQSFAALQLQHYPPIYQPHPLRTRSSHPSQNSSYSASSAKLPRDRSSMTSGARTVGSTPVQSPGLFSASSSKYRSADDLEDAQYSAPLLHPTHLQAPKE